MRRHLLILLTVLGLMLPVAAITPLSFGGLTHAIAINGDNLPELTLDTGEVLTFDVQKASASMSGCYAYLNSTWSSYGYARSQVGASCPSNSGYHSLFMWIYNNNTGATGYGSCGLYTWCMAVGSVWMAGYHSYSTEGMICQGSTCWQWWWGPYWL